MLKGAIARRYAGAIFELAQKQDALDRTLEDVKGIAQVFANRKLAYLLREPKIPAQRKEKVIRQALTGKVLPASLNLALLVVQRELVEACVSTPRQVGLAERLSAEIAALRKLLTRIRADEQSSDSTLPGLEWPSGRLAAAIPPEQP